MSTANLQNCKRLYELSGWDDTSKYWSLDDSFHQSHPEWDEWELVNHDMGGKADPAYDLGYLLRKLPKEIVIERNQTGTHYLPDWRAKLGLGSYSATADTPEDAACLLAIKLIEEGVIT